MNDSPVDYRDEFEVLHDFVIDTLRIPESFRFFHWFVSTTDRQRFAWSSAIAGGPVDMSVIANTGTAATSVRRQLGAMLSFPLILAVEGNAEDSVVSLQEMLANIRCGSNAKLVAVSAGGQRLTEDRAWMSKMAFVGFHHDSQCFDDGSTLARRKPLTGSKWFSRRPLEIGVAREGGRGPELG